MLALIPTATGRIILDPDERKCIAGLIQLRGVIGGGGDFRRAICSDHGQACAEDAKQEFCFHTNGSSRE
jgi:hypothetical protein